jgi:hypothetical protein
LSPREEISAFLRSDAADPQRRHQVALEFARGMTIELRAVLSEWDAVVETLEHVEPIEPILTESSNTEWRRNG